MARRATSRLLERAATPVSAASLAFVRIAFGLAMAVNALLYLPSLVREWYVEPSFHFTYEPFGFVEPLPGIGMYLVYIAMCAAGLLIALGLFYRVAASAFFLLTTYVFLLDSTFFQSHEYLISLLAFLMVFLPADRMWSLDARRRPDRASATVPAWAVWLLRFQIGIPYFFSGLAKLNADWLAGEPMRTWLARRTDIELIGPLFDEEPVVLFMTYGAVILDLGVVWLLLARRTRAAAFAVAVCFHLLNARMFGLFVFPWLMIAGTTIFFEPDWPRRLAARVRARTGWRGGAARREVETAPAPPASGGRVASALAAALALWVAVQVLVPLRHFAIGGEASWTEEAHRFSWHMRLRDKEGSVTYVLSAGGRSWRVDPADHLGRQQVRRLASNPARIAQFARHLSRRSDGAEVRAQTAVRLNGRGPAPIVDPTVDLATAETPAFGHADWILPAPDR